MTSNPLESLIINIGISKRVEITIAKKYAGIFKLPIEKKTAKKFGSNNIVINKNKKIVDESTLKTFRSMLSNLFISQLLLNTFRNLSDILFFKLMSKSNILVNNIVM